MAHEIMETDNLFSLRKTPWHGLGVILNDAPTTKEAIVAAGLDWNVRQEKLISASGIETNHVLNIRDTDNMPLGVVGENYKVLQNIEAFNFFDDYVKGGLVTLETSGSLNNGKTIWILAKINSLSGDVVGNDNVNGYFLLSNGHAGNRSIQIGFTNVRVVCNNTLSASDSEKNFLRAYHTKNMDIKMLKNSIDLATQSFNINQDKYKKLSAMGFRENDIIRLVKGIFYPKQSLNDMSDRQISNFKDKIDSIKRLHETGRGTDLKGIKNTRWGLYNAVNEHLNYEIGKNVDSRINSLWLGNGKNLDQKCLNLLLAA